MKKEIIKLDGSFGEGGGQILRSALTLSAITGIAFEIANIRSNRKKPGLLRQHLTCVNAVAKICNAKVTGNEMGSTTLFFNPGTVKPGNYHFQIGSAGSTSLVLQTIVPILMIASGPSKITIEGGTHVAFAPIFDFINLSYIPLINKMGPKIMLELCKRGFYPAGGGKLIIDITPVESLKGLTILDKGKLLNKEVIIANSKMSPKISEREFRSFNKILQDPSIESVVSEDNDSLCPGNAFSFLAEYENVTYLTSALAEFGITSELIGKNIGISARDYLASDIPIDPYLADQLLLPLALAGNGSFKTGKLTNHFKTNIEVIKYFLSVEIDVKEFEKENIIKIF